MPASTLKRSPKSKKRRVPTLNEIMCREKPTKNFYRFTELGLIRLGEVLRISRESLVYQNHPDEELKSFSLRLTAELIEEQTGEQISKDTLWMLERGQSHNPTVSTLMAIANAGYVIFPDDPETEMDFFDLIDVATGRLNPFGEEDLKTFEELCSVSNSGVGFTQEGLKALGRLIKKSRLEIQITDDTRIQRSITIAELSELIYRRTGIRIPIEELEDLESGSLENIEPRIFAAVEATRFVYKKDKSLYTTGELIEVACGELYPNGNGKKQVNGN